MLSPISLLTFLSLVYSFGSEQRIRVRGTVICDGKRTAGVTVRLMEEDTTFNDRLAEIITGPDGNFDLTGKDEEVSKIDPYLVIEHTCKAQPKKKRIVHWAVNQKYVNDPEGYDMTLVALDIFHKEEEEEDV